MVEIDSTPAEDVDPVTERRNWLVNQWLDAKDAVVKHGEMVDQYEKELIAELGDGGRHQLMDGIEVRVQPPSMLFDPQLAKEKLTAEQYQLTLEYKPSATRATKMLPGALVDICRRPGSKSTVKLVGSRKRP